MKLLPSIAIAASAVILTFTACTSVPVPTTTKQEQIANAVEDVVAIGMIPVLTKNPHYVSAAAHLATALAGFSGSSLTPEDIALFLDRIPMPDEDAKIVAGLINTAWSIYRKRYAALVGVSVRPDVKLFLSAVSNGILVATSAKIISQPESGKKKQ